MAVGFLQPRR